MKSLRALFLACFMLFAGEAGCPQTLSTLILPSEDELIEALYNGEIDYDQYVILLDLVQQGIDSSNFYLLDEIPNLSLIEVDSEATATALESDQAAAFVTRQSGKTGNLGYVNYRYLQSLEQDSRTSYRLSSKLNLSETWRTSFQLRREYSGRERWISRYAEYHRSDGFIRRLVLGNFNARLGLGTVYGYRGKLVSYSDRLDRESFLFPDYGGFNGLYLKGQSGAIQIDGIASSARDDTFSITSAGGSVSYRQSKLIPGLVVGVTRVANRTNGKAITDGKLGFNTSYEYHRGYSRAEIVTQTGHGVPAWSAALEGKHRLSWVEFRYRGWSYAPQYLNLTGGSMSASIYCHATVDDLGFDCSDRRVGQTGGQIRAALRPSESWKLTSSAILATRDSGTRNVEILGSAQYLWSPSISTQIDYLARNHRRTVDGELSETSDRRWRLETRIQSGKLVLRSYIANTWDSDDGVYSSVLLSAKGSLPSIGSLELWSNFGRIRNGKLEYWYLFARLEQQLLEDVLMAIKFAHVYRWGSARSSQPSLSLELEARL